jgi:hypothetical protein
MSVLHGNPYVFEAPPPSARLAAIAVKSSRGGKIKLYFKITLLFRIIAASLIPLSWCAAA